MYPEPCQTSRMKSFAEVVNGLFPITTFIKHSILDAWHGSEYASDLIVTQVILTLLDAKNVNLVKRVETNGYFH